MIAHRLHSFLLHSPSSVLLSPKVHALFVPWKNSPEVTIPPPTSAFTFELVALVRTSRGGRRTTRLLVQVVIPHLVSRLEEPEYRSNNGQRFVWVQPPLFEQLLD